MAIVDDHELARESLQNMLSDEPDIDIVGEAANGRQALLLCSRFRLDLILMDVRMPVMDGLAATKEVKQRYPEISVMMLTMHDNPDYLLEALKAGAAGYVLKDAPREEIIEAVRRVRNGESPLDPELAARLLRRLASEGERRRGTGGSHETAYAVEPLTPRELEVLGLMKLGRTNRQIAGDLVISLGTAKNHVEHIISKLGVSDRTRAVVQALELGLIDLR
ncbi:MAG: Two-component transcriptional response regulator, LuxR family [uncultured Rubrobacteraceae bacterium]|uniref:Two-component transcriptional response regulator, LuxR family n=1 Tax=uncultured Rubrobacteraceae bacterium TaxID=349277 RepID=A0A6J4RE96_9ACTN|nr:MAG: Two-component transcriptional response regulator, LuxR family [uncultured Rubrobacteraceae bacterium]